MNLHFLSQYEIDVTIEVGTKDISETKDYVNYKNLQSLCSQQVSGMGMEVNTFLSRLFVIHLLSKKENNIRVCNNKYLRSISYSNSKEKKAWF